MGTLTEEPAADQAGERDAGQGAQTRDHALAQRRPREDRPEQAKSQDRAGLLVRADGVGHTRAPLQPAAASLADNLVYQGEVYGPMAELQHL